LKYLPQCITKAGTIAFDKLASAISKNYRNKSHKDFFTETGYQNYAQIGALKIPSAKKVLEWFENAPKLEDFVDKINQPTLMIYGGEDRMLGIKNGELTDKLKKMYQKLGSKNKNLMIIPGVNHCFNEITFPDEDLCKDPKYDFMKEAILKHFEKWML